MPIQNFTARVADSTLLTDKFHYLHLELIEPKRIVFTAGQYILLSVPGTEQKKSYSIASSPEMDHAIELLIDMSPLGVGTTYINNLKLGDVVQFSAPSGQFAIAQPGTPIGDSEKALVFIATGSGITPVKSMILDQLQTRKDVRKIILHWGLRLESDLCWLDEFEELARAFPNFQFHPVLSKAEAEWPLCRGRVTDCFEIHPMVPEAGYYLCGNKQMIDDVQKFLLQKGVSNDRIHHEKFY